MFSYKEAEHKVTQVINAKAKIWIQAIWACTGPSILLNTVFMAATEKSKLALMLFKICLCCKSV